jgi:hypothetical protein
MAKTLEEIRIRPADNGGHTVMHSFKRPELKGKERGNGIWPERPTEEEHIFGKGEHDEMFDHIHEALGCCKGGQVDAASKTAEEEAP